ncbi:hypothetical protein HETIRDRAFT_326628 [Heterobasidion irregulare TC 32-1]|uniref:DUF6534 domain-containing protein n=1 Tax=Heterobasidion irregulare (strain TC 32-1) TaxID=747525 RepID=W4JTX7_HETIT|nr:uncharacterized protein HETIRDRAFT_326628 [Heterobasidion irregulare TC 32-1]ETW77017.1 hypothetical protein HETIRDRAFT_326628 [Heterobasidion irregulare TC 32-1]
MPSLIPLDDSLGATYIGVIVSTGIYGVTCLQVYLYYTQHCSNDGRFLKAFVAILTLLDTFHVVLLAHFMYIYTVANFGDYRALVPLCFLIEFVIGDLLSVLVQIFFAYRIYCLSGRRTLIPPASIPRTSMFGTLDLLRRPKADEVNITTAGALGEVLRSTVIGFRAPTFFSERSEILLWTIISTAVEISCDVLITGFMIFHLRKCRTQFERTNRAINLLITYTLNTSALTNLVKFLTLHQSLVFTAFFFILVRLYFCSFMSSLNSRDFVRQELNSKQDEVITLSRFAAAEAGVSLQREDTVGRSVESHKGFECSSSKLHHTDDIATEDQTNMFDRLPIGLLDAH